MNFLIKAQEITEPISGRKFTFFDILVNVITWFLWIAGALAVIYLIYGGIIYITSAGNEEKVKAGKSAVLYAIIGIIIIVLSYAIVSWVSNILQTEAPK